MIVKSISQEDIRIIANQLKRAPRGLKSIVSRCELNYPLAIENEAFTEDGKPFPTIYWLTCPVKIKAISQLEDEGWASKMQEKIASDETLRNQLYAAQESYKSKRRSGVKNASHPLFETGIAGVKDPIAIKCLHAHYAHYLATGDNPIGKMVEEKISGLRCTKRCD